MTSFLQPCPEFSSTRKAVDWIRKTNPNVLAVISRCKNRNLVVYEMLRDPEGHMQSIDTYWLLLDENFRRRNRQRRVAHDREGLLALEKPYYELEVVQRESARRWAVKFPQFPDVMVIDDHKTRGASLLREMSNGQTQTVTHIALDDREVLGVPKVDGFRVYGRCGKKNRKVMDTVRL